MTNLGALTTPYAGGSACSSYAGFTQSDWGDQSLFLVQGPVPTKDCFPSNYNPAPDAYYSPGVCPVGFTVACSSINAIGTVSETIQTCCPSHAALTYTCLGAPNIQVNPWQQTLGCTRRMSTVTSLAPLTYIADGNTQTVPTSTFSDPRGGMGAYAVVVRHQDKDLSPTPTATSSSSSSGSGSVASTSSSSPASTNTAGSSSAGSSSSSSASLSLGAIVGIAVGCGAAVVLLGLGLFLFWRKRSRNQNQNQSESHGHEKHSPTETYPGSSHYSPGSTQNSPDNTTYYSPGNTHNSPDKTHRSPGNTHYSAGESYYSPAKYEESSSRNPLNTPRSPAELGDNTTYELGTNR